MSHKLSFIRIHLGSHFWGAGNFGDDLMLAGFMHALHELSVRVKLTCCSAFDLDSQRLRFPEIQWFTYTDENRTWCIKNCDVWLCLGGSPFQTVLSDWFLQHLAQEHRFCETSQKKMFFLGVGLNDHPALEHPITRMILSSATHIWARDSLTAHALRAVNAQSNLSEGSDLSHLFLQHHHKHPQPNNKKTGLVINFEEDQMSWNKIMIDVIKQAGGLTQCYWIAQETRLLPGSEGEQYAFFTQGDASKSTLLQSNYKNSTVHDFLIPYQGLSLLVTSRYHSALIGAWQGCRVVLMERNLKLKGLAQQWPLQVIRATDETCAEAFYSAGYVDKARLFEACDRAYSSVEEWIAYL